MIHIAIVDDKKNIANTIKAGLERFGDCEVILMAENGRDFLEQMREARRTVEPQLVLMDIDMPIMNGIETVAAANQRYPQMLYIMLTIFDEDAKIFDALKAGANGYLLKDEPIEKIHSAIVDLLNGLSAPMSPSIARRVFGMLQRSTLSASDPLPAAKKEELDLSDREIQILKLLIDGYEYKEIGTALKISPHTVRNHITKIYRKLHVTSRAFAIKVAAGIIN
jgi:DNA-binding NarL/FixJ family response regulator